MFGDTSLQATSSDVSKVMVYASADSTTPGHYVFVAINRSTSSQVTAINGVSRKLAVVVDQAVKENKFSN